MARLAGFARLRTERWRGKACPRQPFLHAPFESRCGYNQKNPRTNVLGFLARLAGFEPATYRFVAGHSIH